MIIIIIIKYITLNVKSSENYTKKERHRVLRFKRRVRYEE